MPSSFASGWSPVSRSMIASRRAARPTGPVDADAVRVGPAVTQRRAHRGEPARGRRPRGEAMPQIPHMARQSTSGIRPARGRTGGARARRSRRRCAGRAATERSAIHSRSCASFSAIDVSWPRRICAKPGQPRPDDEPLPVRGISAASSLEEARPDRARADERHVAAQHVPELRHLVELRRPQPAADARELLGVRCDELRAEVRAEPALGAGPQRAELAHPEDAAVAADPLAAVEERPAAVASTTRARSASAIAESSSRCRARRSARSSDPRSATSTPWPAGRVLHRQPRVALRQRLLAVAAAHRRQLGTSVDG